MIISIPMKLLTIPMHCFMPKLKSFDRISYVIFKTFNVVFVFVDFSNLFTELVKQSFCVYEHFGHFLICLANLTNILIIILLYNIDNINLLLTQSLFHFINVPIWLINKLFVKSRINSVKSFYVVLTYAQPAWYVLVEHELLGAYFASARTTSSISCCFKKLVLCILHAWDICFYSI